MESSAPDSRLGNSPSSDVGSPAFEADTSINVRGTFEVLSEAVDRFIDAWESDTGPPDISEFLPRSNRTRTAVLAELIKVDLEYRWLKVDLPKRLLEYCEEFPELGANGPPADLIYEEFHIRRRSGLNIDPAEYLEEFPERMQSMRQLLGLDEQYQSTMLNSGVHAAALAAIEVGDRLDDFELLLPLGKGAFAKVFLARQLSMQRLVAVKISEDKGLEPQTLSQLDHNYIVRVYDVRSLPEQGLRLLYMQYVPGGTLEAVCKRVSKVSASQRTGVTLLQVIDESLEKRGDIRPTDSTLRKQLCSMEWPDVVAWLGSRLAQALHYSNERRVQHRDVKPANVLLSAEGVPKLADFNISFGESVQGATAAAYFGGSLAYMSPEQLEACHPELDRQPEELDGRSDLFGLAVLLYELLEGERPFPDDVIPGCWSESLELMIDRRNNAWQEAVDRLSPATPPTLRRILATALQPKREDRWKDGDEFSKQLDLCLNHTARELVDPQPTSWRNRLRPWAMWILIVSVLTPNIISAVANYQYNRSRVVEQLEGALPKFDLIQAWINGIAFPVGTVLLIIPAWYVVSNLPGRCRARENLSEEELEIAQLRARRMSLRLGLMCALICLTLWVIAGVAYPISIKLAGVDLSWSSSMHFVYSLTICGLMATVYPFFGVTYFCINCVYPAFLRQRLSAPGDVQELDRLNVCCDVLHFLAVAIPLLAIAGLSTTTAEERVTVLILAVGGLIAYGLAWLCHRRIHADIDALRSAVG